MQKQEPKRGLISGLTKALAVIWFSLVVLTFFMGPPTGTGHRQALRSALMQEARIIGLTMGQYATDHGGHYPEGATSTEIFQKLIDGKYVEDPSIFYIALPGKVRPLSSQLKPENVAWDVTCCVDSSSPDNLPLVYLTGFKINFQPGSSAKRISPLTRTWTAWWNGPNPRQTFMAMGTKGNSARVFQINDDGSIPNFIPVDFDAQGKTYRQLTP